MSISILASLGATNFISAAAFSFAPSQQSLVVPGGARFAFVEAWGSGGKSASTTSAYRAGAGGFASALVPVAGGETLGIWVGRPGSYGAANQSTPGGGLVGLFRSTAPLLVAGSGGGSSASGPAQARGGDGGDTVGGGGGGYACSGGGGGSQTSGGYGGYSGGDVPRSSNCTGGSYLKGGGGDTYSSDGTGADGGAGYYGGGGGGGFWDYGSDQGGYGCSGGGGGSSFNSAAGNTHGSTTIGIAGNSPMKTSPRFPAGATYGDADNAGYLSVLFYNGDPFAAGQLS